MNLPQNVGKNDKYARLGVGGLLVILAITGAIGPWGFIGLLPIATGLLNTCPAYTLLGINTGGSDKTS